MSAKSLASIIGVIFIAVGILGFFENPIIYDSTTAIFHADKVHNWVHIISGALFLLVALASPGSAKGFMYLFGIVYLAIGVVGFMSVGQDGMGQILGFLHVNGADNYLHIGLGIVIMLAGFISGRPDRASTTRP